MVRTGFIYPVCLVMLLGHAGITHSLLEDSECFESLVCKQISYSDCLNPLAIAC